MLEGENEEGEAGERVRVTKGGGESRREEA